jgi:hypothetical protein
MNRYITISGYILELPILLGILTLITVSVVTLLIFFFSFSKKKPGFKKILLPGLGLILFFSVFGALLVYNDALNLDHSPKPLTNIKKDIVFSNSPTSSTQKRHFKFRYTMSPRLNRLGFVRNVYDDGSHTYFDLNSPKAPVVYIEDSNGDLVDQKDHITIESIPDQPFPVLKVDKLSTVWYLQFNNFVSHIKQVPDFKRSYDAGSVEVFYSDNLFTTLEISKDSFICNQISPQYKDASIRHVRHYFIFENIRYYMDDCFVDNSSELESN